MSASVKWIRSGLLLVVCLSGSLCWGDELFDEVKAGLADAESRLEDCSLQARYRILDVKGDREVLQTAVYSFFQGKYTSYSILDSESGLEEVRAANDKYVFAVTKPQGSDRYSLVEFWPRHSDDKKKQLTIDAGIAGIRMRLFNTYTIAASWPASLLVQDRGFRVLSSERVTRNGQSCIKIVYEAEPKRAINEIITTSPFVGYFICDPAANWAIIEQWIKAKQSDSHGSLRLLVPQRLDNGLAMTAKFFAENVAGSDMDVARKGLMSASASYPAPGHEWL